MSPMVSKKRYAGLTALQTKVLGEIAMGWRDYVHPRMAEVLIRRGFVEAREVIQRERFGEFRRTVYVMPIAEHMRYCQWCAETLYGSARSAPPLTGTPNE